jgi:hypothetical protein
MSTRSRLLAALIAPYLIVIAFGYRSCEGRLISVGYFWALMSVLAMRYSISHFGSKAPEGWRTPKRFANLKVGYRFERAPALGVRQSSAAFF